MIPTELSLNKIEKVYKILSNHVLLTPVIKDQPSINEILNTHPDLVEKLMVGDFTKTISFFDKKFDIILDRASLTCNPTSKIKNCIELIKKELLP